MPQINCPHCLQPNEVLPEQWQQYLGRRIVCTHCNGPFDVTGLVSPPSVPPEPPEPSPLDYASGDFPPKHISGGSALLACLIAVVVIVIGGGILVVIVPKFGSNYRGAKMAAARQEISTLEGAINLFQTDNGRFPTSAEGLAALRVQPATNCQSWHGPYLSHDVVNDPWEHPYVYRVPGKHNRTSFDVFSTGPDGKEGGGDDICNW